MSSNFIKFYQNIKYILFNQSKLTNSQWAIILIKSIIYLNII